MSGSRLTSAPTFSEHRPRISPPMTSICVVWPFTNCITRTTTKGAIALFRQALEEDPKFALACTGLANAYIERVDEFEGEAFWLDSALDLSQQAIALDPKQVRGYTALARAFSWKGFNDQANQCVRKALELAPNDVEALKRAAHQLTDADQIDKKYALLRKCHALSPNDPYAPRIL